MSEFDLKGKTVLLTGAGGFLAEHFLGALAEAGANLALGDIQLETATQRAEQLASRYNVRAIAVEMDVRMQESIDAAFERAIKEFGAVDVVVNNAAIDPKFDASAEKNEATFENYPEEMMRQSVDVNMLGTWRVTKRAVALMLKQGHGNIITISSIYGVTVPHQDIYPEGTQKPVDYGMTKSAVQYLTRYVAGTYGKQGIRSNALVLGGVMKGHDKTFTDKYGMHSMFGRMTEPEEVGSPLVFLASDASRGMTGHLLCVDAGWSAW